MKKKESVALSGYQKFVVFILAITQFTVILDFMVMSPAAISTNSAEELSRQLELSPNLKVELEMNCRQLPHVIDRLPITFISYNSFTFSSTSGTISLILGGVTMFINTKVQIASYL